MLTAKQQELRARIDRGRTKARVAPSKIGNLEDSKRLAPKQASLVPLLPDTPPREKAYRSALQTMRHTEKISPEDDPEHPDFQDPLTRARCQVCSQPENDEQDLMQCFTMLEGHKHCDKWYHPACVGIGCAPDGDWLCQPCTNSQLKFLFLDNNVGPEGLEILDLENESDDDMYESEDDNGELDKSTKSRDEAVSSKEDKDDEDYVPEDEDLNTSDSEPDFDSNSKSACASKKRKAQGIVAIASAQSKKPCHAHDNGSRGLPSNGKWIPRTAGAHPQSARQQQDAQVRAKVKSLKKPIETLQKQSLPFKRSDAYDPSNPDFSTLALNQSHWPWVVHGAFCLTNQAPNDDGSKEAQFSGMPQLHMWAGSTPAANWAANLFQQQDESHGGLPFDVKLYTDFESYYNAFRSDSGKKKQPPPRPGRS